MRRWWLWFPRWLRRTFSLILGLILLGAVLVGWLWWYLHPDINRIDGVVYGQRNGQDLTLDVLRPKRPNGLGIALMVSGGWRSKDAGEFDASIVAPFLRKGYTIFAICHVSQPEALIMEIIDDVTRGVRFVRHHASDYQIDPNRLGITGGSAGGHLSLMIATTGGPGDPTHTDPVERASSAVQAVAILYPTTDLLNLGASTENLRDGGPPKSFTAGFGAGATDKKTWQRIGRESSPIYQVHAKLPPTRIHHGDADTLIPLEQSQRYQVRAQEVGAAVELRVHRGGEHGWLTIPFDLWQFARWFDRVLEVEK